MELQAVLTSDAKYAAFALSNDAWMGEDSAMACSVAAGVEMYHNVDDGTVKTAIRLDDATLGISDPSVAITDGIITCR